MLKNKTDCIAIVTGPEHSGTTYFASLINSHSQVFSGFECGVLLGSLESFHKVKPFSDWLKHGKMMFGLPETYLQDIRSMNYEEVFAYISKNKGSRKSKKQEDSYQKILRNTKYFVDKTPAYVYQIEEISRKIINLNIPIFIIFKDFDSFYLSISVNRKLPFQNFPAYVEKTIQTLRILNEKKLENVFVFDYFSTINHPDVVQKKLQEILYRYNPNLKTESLGREKYLEKVKGVSEYPMQNWKKMKNWQKSLKKRHVWDNKMLMLKKEYNQLLQNLLLTPTTIKPEKESILIIHPVGPIFEKIFYYWRILKHENFRLFYIIPQRIMLMMEGIFKK